MVGSKLDIHTPAMAFFLAPSPIIHKQGPRYFNEVQVGKDQEKAQSEKDSHSKNRGGKNQTNNQVLIP